ncbi:beta-1,4-N-acetylgalactosaminyltransferase bre-4-like isoform X1 [Tigriopus californicus]|nr:beta-1,4-N-acetylgalactosaminyltransferase bre-4-like isoform X1 [Tigriopus californicus]|eukprot:TCALIF_05716-PA protein Name:"Similar to bre-4 Beta-1,4-N-acetylgalactosaminyltransferase bre-4 (Caenorhabditis briggsae)" AED:0.20 eAED:0.23 QI:0/-1/0/1/-1/1/1/0/383
MALHTYLPIKVLLFIIICLIGLQYLSLLQVNERRRSHVNRSLFTLNWGDTPTLHSESGRAYGKIPLLKSISRYFEEKSNQNSTGVDEVDPEIDEHMNPSMVGQVGNGSMSGELPQCPMIPPDLHGPVKVNVRQVPATMSEIEQLYPHLQPGGRYKPPNCTSRHRVAIIVPFRAREDHLRTFLLNIHSFLKKQLLDYGIFIIEQYGDGPFNRAMLLNVGAAEALKQYDYQCFVFHDVDLLPEDDRNLYTCPVQPRHMSVAINNFLYRLPYDDIFGGVSAMKVEHYREVNGFSNMFWGWGGEDDDISNRLRQKKLYISRYPANIARYKMLRHSKDKANPERFKYLYSGAKRMSKDGYNSLKYKRIDLLLKRLYTWILVDLPHLKR